MAPSALRGNARGGRGRGRRLMRTTGRAHLPPDGHGARRTAHGARRTAYGVGRHVGVHAHRRSAQRSRNAGNSPGGIPDCHPQRRADAAQRMLQARHCIEIRPHPMRTGCCEETRFQHHDGHSEAVVCRCIPCGVVSHAQVAPELCERNVAHDGPRRRGRSRRRGASGVAAAARRRWCALRTRRTRVAVR